MPIQIHCRHDLITLHFALARSLVRLFDRSFALIRNLHTQCVCGANNNFLIGIFIYFVLRANSRQHTVDTRCSQLRPVTVKCFMQYARVRARACQIASNDEIYSMCMYVRISLSPVLFATRSSCASLLLFFCFCSFFCFLNKNPRERYELLCKVFCIR